ncbi:hypothetical protein EDC96DRAFT_563056 [Choanephora cucurbitarum]|nr:hypothetical protein EDC96DRAFT_563056 [Choanephora cucurbitarum]
MMKVLNFSKSSYFSTPHFLVFTADLLFLSFSAMNQKHLSTPRLMPFISEGVYEFPECTSLKASQSRCNWQKQVGCKHKKVRCRKVQILENELECRHVVFVLTKRGKKTDFDLVHIKRPDVLLLSEDGVELGNGEVKPFGASPKEVEEDEARVPEMMKQQLHRRLVSSRSTKEHQAFGINFVGDQVTLSSLSFPGYKYSIVGQFKLPTFEDSCSVMEHAVEIMTAFQALVKSTIPVCDEEEEEEEIEEEEEEKKYLDVNLGDLKPTILFVKDDN